MADPWKRKEVTGNAVSYADSLARKNSEALSFIPRPRIEQYASCGQLMLQMENDEPCGFLIHGVLGRQVRIFQACIQFDARRREHATSLLSRLIAKALAAGSEGIGLRCADDLEANAFWREIGFALLRQVRGGSRRGRLINEWYLPLFACERIENAQRQERLFA